MSRRVTRGGARKFRQWRKRIAGDVIPEAATQFHAKVHFQIAEGVIMATPVGNPSLWQSPPPPGYTGGRARGSWQSSVHDPILREPGGTDKSGNATVAASAAVAESIPFASKSYVTSAVPYMLRLNAGWSTQMPAGFIERALDRAGAQFA